MSDTQADMLNSELTEALRDTRDADNALRASLDDGAPAPQLSSEAVQTVRAAEIEVMRQRANRERERGKKALDKRHAGVASVIQAVQLMEHVTGSSFQRWFAPIEKGIVAVTKRGTIFVGQAAADRLVQALTARIEAIEVDIAASLAGVKARIAAIDESTRLSPEYAAPAAQHEVQIRHPLALRVLNIIKNGDAIIQGLVVLEWNGEVEERFRTDEEQKIKRSIRELHLYLSRTVRGMLTKVEEKAAAHEASQQAGAATESGSVAAADAALETA